MGKNHQNYKKNVRNDIWNPLHKCKTIGSKFFRQSWRKIIGQIRFPKQILRPTSDSNVKLQTLIEELSQLIYIYRRT